MEKIKCEICRQFVSWSEFGRFLMGQDEFDFKIEFIHQDEMEY